ncbi:MAG: Na+/H+ antiporter subunit C [Geminicoccaceae bacterium]|nr:MAG: Na+/H+ antiporter subunit C [Geminicoccaceae bacterium]
MSTWLLYASSGALLVAIGLHGLILRRHLIRRILGLNVLGGGVFAIFLALAARGDGPADPLPHALVITGIVVAVAGTALALAITVRYFEATGRLDIDGPDNR